MALDFIVISIGTLSHNPLWGEVSPVRTAHATTTLVRDADRWILVDPSLPSSALAARFNERTGKDLSAVTDVFCTTLRPVHCRSVEAMPNAQWWCSETELASYTEYLRELQASAERMGGEDCGGIQAELRRVNRFRPAPERFTPRVQLYPLAGPSAGSAGLLLASPLSTIVVAGDAALTAEHIQSGRVWEGCADSQQALQSLEDLLELADVIVPGHDNVVFSPQRHWF